MYELLGLRIEGVDGEFLGVLSRVESTSANDVYIVEGPERSFPVPAVREIIKRIDLEAGKIVIELVDGLFDLEV